MKSNARRQAHCEPTRQALGGTKCEAEIEVLRAAIIKAELARAQAENHLLRQRLLDLEKALVRRESSVKSAQTKAASEVARLKEKNKELKFKLRQMWDWHNNEITKTGGLTFKASSLIAKALHPDATPSEEIRLDAFNLLNRKNIQALNNIVGLNPAAPPASFGTITAVRDQRQAQIALRYRF